MIGNSSEKIIEFAVFGQSGKGKSTFLNHFFKGYKLARSSNTTVGAIQGELLAVIPFMEEVTSICNDEIRILSAGGN
jgi:ABC-type lipoprotein export system ATPase subunit